MDPQFPLSRAPACLICDEPCTLDTVKESNEHGNAGRPYYFCLDPSHDRKFSTFNDYKGIYDVNPRCRCGFTSRRGISNGPNGKEFFNCSVGGCGFWKRAWSNGSEPPMYNGQAPMNPRGPPVYAMKAPVYTGEAPTNAGQTPINAGKAPIYVVEAPMRVRPTLGVDTEAQTVGLSATRNRRCCVGCVVM
jgi:hypothetical protein